MTGAVELVILVIALIGFWAIIMRPARNQQRSVRELQSSLAVGDEVILSAGIFGTIRSVEDSRVRIEIAPDTVVTVARQVVVRRQDGASGATPASAPDAVDRPDPDERIDDEAGRAPEEGNE